MVQVKHNLKGIINREHHNRKMTSSIDWGYDKLRDRRANSLAKQEEYKNMSARSRYDEIMMKHTQNSGKRINSQEGARNTLDKAGYDFSDLSGYDHSSSGNSKFDNTDIKFLQKQGKTDDEIKNYIGTLGADALDESLRYNKDFSGDHYVGDHDRNTKLISDFDTGRGYNASDIHYLKRQGYTGAEIAEDMVNRADHFGGASAKFLKEQGRFDDWDAANQARRSEAKDRAQEQIKKPDKTTSQPENNQGNGMPDLSGFKTPMPGSNSGNSGNSGNNSNNGMPDLTNFYTQMPGSNSGNSNNSGNNTNNNSGGMPDLTNFYTQMPGSNSNSNSSNSSGGLDLSKYMTPMGGSSSGNNNSGSSSGGLDLSKFMTPMNGYGSSSDSDDKKNKYNGGLDLSRYMNNY